MIWIAAIIILILLMYGLRKFELSQIYYPRKFINQTPDQVYLKYEDITFKASDGVKLNGWYIPNEEAKVTLLYCHGNGGNIGDRLDIIQLLHNLGANIFIFDYRGYGKSQGSLSEKGTYRDAQGAYEYLLTRRDIDKKKIVYYGESLGGAVAIDLATRIKPAGIIIVSSFTSIQDISREIFPVFPIRWLISTKYDSIDKIKTLKCPILIAHSREDDVVPYHHGEELYAAAKYPKEFLELRGTHGEAITLAGQKGIYQMSEFIMRYSNEDK